MKTYTKGLWDRGDVKIPVFIYGKCTRRDEGIVGHDVKIRPVSIGNPDEGYTAVVGGLDVIYDN